MNATAGGEAEGKGGGVGVELLKILRAKSRDVTLSATLNTEIPFARTILPYKRLRGSYPPHVVRVYSSLSANARD